MNSCRYDTFPFDEVCTPLMSDSACVFIGVLISDGLYRHALYHR